MLVEEKTLLTMLIGSVDIAGFMLEETIVFTSQFLSGKHAFGNRCS